VSLWLFSLGLLLGAGSLLDLSEEFQRDATGTMVELLLYEYGTSSIKMPPNDGVSTPRGRYILPYATWSALGAPVRVCRLVVIDCPPFGGRDCDARILLDCVTCNNEYMYSYTCRHLSLFDLSATIQFHSTRTYLHHNPISTAGSNPQITRSNTPEKKLLPKIGSQTLH
jgi:hypothetical protein